MSIISHSLLTAEMYLLTCPHCIVLCNCNRGEEKSIFHSQEYRMCYLFLLSKMMNCNNILFELLLFLQRDVLSYEMNDLLTALGSYSCRIFGTN